MTTSKAKSKGVLKPESTAAKASGKFKSAKAAALEEAANDAENGAGAKRVLGLRGAAPWAARHAAKHAAEARARASEPPPPGSARATIRTPTGVEAIKAQIVELHNTLEQMKALRKNMAKNFFEVGGLLKTIQEHKLYAAKGFQSFESFLEREIDLGKNLALKLARVAYVFQRQAALEYGLDRTIEALNHLEAGTEASHQPPPAAVRPPPPAPASGLHRPPILGR